MQLVMAKDSKVIVLFSFASDLQNAVSYECLVKLQEKYSKFYTISTAFPWANKPGKVANSHLVKFTPYLC